MKRILLPLVICVCFSSCLQLGNNLSSTDDCKKYAVKELKRLGKFISPPAKGGIYTYLHQDVEVPKGFETIFWERKIGRDYAVSVQLYDTTAMQFLQLSLSLQNIVYGDCDGSLLKEDLISHIGEPSYKSKSFLQNAKQNYTYSFNHPDRTDCYHGEYMGQVAYQDCLSISMDIDSRGRVVELNTSSFVIEEE